MAANIAAAAAAAQEVDPVLKKAVKLLHSSNASSVAELRMLLDEALKLRYGTEKLISNNLTQRMLEDESNFPGRAVTPPPQQQPQQAISDEIINLTNSPDKAPSDSPATIVDSDDGLTDAGVGIPGVLNTGDTGDFDDLNCCVCDKMVFTATNRLVECRKCGGLYHQDCHKPPITKEAADQEHNWQCDTCLTKPTTSKEAAATATTLTPTVIITDEPMPLVSKAKSSVASSRSSTSSNSSSPFYKPETGSSTNASSSSSSKHGHKAGSSSSSSKSHKEERAGKTVASTLNVVSAPEKHGGSSSTSSSRRTSSSKTSSTKTSSSTSKHHESSSGKRRAK